MKSTTQPAFIRHSAFGVRPSNAFTLVELLVVIAVISILIGILIPTVNKIRVSSQEAATRSLIGQIDAACQAYYSDFQAYPGPMSGVFMSSSQKDGGGDALLYIWNGTNESTALTDGDASAGWNGVNAGRLTGTENLVLGLTGGLQTHRTDANYKSYNKDSVGLGPARFNPKRPGRANAYMQNVNLSEGKFTDDASQLNPAKDTIVPEFIDSFASPMPILYMRARKGGASNPTTPLNSDNNNVVTDQLGGQYGQYNVLEIAAYTQSSIGVGKTLKPGDYKGHQGSPVVNYPHGLISILQSPVATPTTGEPMLDKASKVGRYPYDAYAYFTEPSSDVTSAATPARLSKHRARKTDGFILISAGKDRVYGTEDDLTNFGNVLP